MRTPTVSRRYEPFHLFPAGLAVLIGLSALRGNPQPGSMNAAMDYWVSVVQGLGLLVSGLGVIGGRAGESLYRTVGGLLASLLVERVAISLQALWLAATVALSFYASAHVHFARGDVTDSPDPLGLVLIVGWIALLIFRDRQLAFEVAALTKPPPQAIHDRE